MTVNKELRLEAKAALCAKRKKAFLAFFTECFLLVLPFATLLLLDRSGFSAALRNNLWLAFAILAAVSAVLLLFFRAFNARLFLVRKDKKRRFGSAISAAVLEFLLAVIRAGLFLFCLLPFSAMIFCIAKAVSNEIPLNAVAVMGAFAVSLLVLGAIFYRRFSALLFLAPYIYCSGSCTMAQSIKMSFQKSDGNIESFLGLRRSFSGWFLLCLFIFPAAYVWSYYKLTEAIFAERLI